MPYPLHHRATSPHTTDNLSLFKLSYRCDRDWTRDVCVADAVDGYDPALIMDGSPDLYDERLLYNGGAAAGRYGYPSVPARSVLIHHFVGCLLINMVIMVALWNRADHYIFALWFLSSIFFLSLPNLSGHRLDVYHTSTHDVALVRI